MVGGANATVNLFVKLELIINMTPIYTSKSFVSKLWSYSVNRQNVTQT